MKKTSLMLATVLLIGSVLTAGCSVTVDVNDNGCKYSAQREATLDLSGAKSIRVRAGAGSLDIRGQEKLTQVKATGTACAGSQDLVDRMQLKAERSGDEIIITAQIPTTSVSVGSSPKLDFQVDVPNDVAIMVDDPSGTTEIANVINLRLKKGSGTTRVSTVAGTVDLESSSGEKTLNNIAGTINVSDGSGTLTIRNAAGTVNIREKSSGEVTVDTAAGTVTADRLGSGTATFRSIKGDVVVDSKSSGELRIDNVEKSVLIRSSGSGTVEVTRVKGDLTIERKSSGSIVQRDIGGRIQIPSK